MACHYQASSPLTPGVQYLYFPYYLTSATSPLLSPISQQSSSPPSSECSPCQSSCCHDANCPGIRAEISLPDLIQVDMSQTVIDLIDSITWPSDVQKTPQTPNKNTCNICNQVFKFRSGLRKHMMLSHQMAVNGLYNYALDDSKPFECQYCPMMFNNMNQKSKHERKHRAKFECSMCKRTYIEKVFLRRHMKKMHE